MITLTLAFATFPELVAFVAKHGDEVLKGDITHDGEIKPPVLTSAQKAAATKAAKKAAEAASATGAGESFSGGAGQTNTAHDPGVQPTASQTPPPMTFNREASIARASALVAQLQTSGIADDQVMPQIHQVYTAAQCDVNKRISELDDASLVRFMPLFERKVQDVLAWVAQNAKPAAPVSFI